MALVDDVLDRFQVSKVFTTLDLANGFFHVPIEVESRKFTSFVTHNGQYEFTLVPFGISNSFAVFCRYVGAVLRDLMQSNKIVVYIDDIIIPTADEESGLSVLKEVLEVASKAGLRINWEKGQFLKRKITFLIENGTIAPTDDKVKVASGKILLHSVHSRQSGEVRQELRRVLDNRLKERKKGRIVDAN